MKYLFMIFMLFLYLNTVLAQQKPDEITILTQDTLVILKKKATSVQICVKLHNSSKADTLLVKNFFTEVIANLYYMPARSGSEQVNCEASRLFFRIENTKGEIIDNIYSINLDKSKSVRRSNLLNDKAQIIDTIGNQRFLYLSNDTTLNLTVLIRDYFSLPKGKYNLYIYYCNTYDKTLLQFSTPSLITLGDSHLRVEKRFFIGQFSTKAIVLVVK